MIFYVFYSNFRIHGRLENAVSEHTEWLKSFPGALPQNPALPQIPQLYHALPGSEKVRCS